MPTVPRPESLIVRAQSNTDCHSRLASAGRRTPLATCARARVPARLVDYVGPQSVDLGLLRLPGCRLRAGELKPLECH
jgi:hypothetical protein